MRAGTTTRYLCGDIMTEKDGNFSPPTFVRELMRAFAGAKTSDVGVYTANPWGLYDMHGNVWEWLKTSGTRITRVRRQTAALGFRAAISRDA